MHRARFEAGVLHVVADYEIGTRVGARRRWRAGCRMGARCAGRLRAPGGGRPVTPIVSGLTSGRDQMNDGVCHPAGRFWAGSQAIPREPNAALFRLVGDGSVTRCWSRPPSPTASTSPPDGATMYYVDTLPHRRLEAFDVTGVSCPGGASSPRSTGGNPDGLASTTRDASGWRSGTLAVHRYAPTDELLATVDLPVPRPTAVCFRAAPCVITTAWLGLDRSAAWSGRLFAVDAGVGGPPASPGRGHRPPRGRERHEDHRDRAGQDTCEGHQNQRVRATMKTRDRAGRAAMKID